MGRAGNPMFQGPLATTELRQASQVITPEEPARADNSSSYARMVKTENQGEYHS